MNFRATVQLTVAGLTFKRDFQLAKSRMPRQVSLPKVAAPHHTRHDLDVARRAFEVLICSECLQLIGEGLGHCHEGLNALVVHQSVRLDLAVSSSFSAGQPWRRVAVVSAHSIRRQQRLLVNIFYFIFCVWMQQRTQNERKTAAKRQSR